jgi:hypothetical protein
MNDLGVDVRDKTDLIKRRHKRKYDQLHTLTRNSVGCLLRQNLKRSEPNPEHLSRIVLTKVNHLLRAVKPAHASCVSLNVSRQASSHLAISPPCCSPPVADTMVEPAREQAREAPKDQEPVKKDERLGKVAAESDSEVIAVAHSSVGAFLDCAGVKVGIGNGWFNRPEVRLARIGGARFRSLS